jgi:hypothetical protein
MPVEVYETDDVHLGGLTEAGAETAALITSERAFGGAIAYRSEPCIVIYDVPCWIMPNGKVRVGDIRAPMLDAADVPAEVLRLRDAGPATVFVAAMDTESYSWLATGPTEKEARQALAAGWERAMRRAGATVFADYVDIDSGITYDGQTALEQYGCNTVEIRFGDCARDWDTV